MEHVDVLITTEEDARQVFAAVPSPQSRSRSGSTSARWQSHCGTIRTPRSPLRTGKSTPHRAKRCKFGIGLAPVDAFSGGLIVSRLENRGWDEAVRSRPRRLPLKLTIPGDFCLVTRNEVDQLLRGASSRVSR